MNDRNYRYPGSCHGGSKLTWRWQVMQNPTYLIAPRRCLDLTILICKSNKPNTDEGTRLKQRFLALLALQVSSWDNVIHSRSLVIGQIDSSDLLDYITCDYVPLWNSLPGTAREKNLTCIPFTFFSNWICWGLAVSSYITTAPHHLIR